MKLNNEENEMIIKALLFYINNYNLLTYEELRKMSDLKEKIKIYNIEISIEK